MNNNIFLLMGIENSYAVLNSGFDGAPKMDAKGNIVSSPYAYQYPIKSHMSNRGKKVFGRAIERQDGSLHNISEQYAYLTNKTKKEKVEYKTVLYDLLSFEDIKQFGITYTGKPNVSITGAVQIQEGLNKYNDSSIMIDKILSPYTSDKKSKEKDEDDEDGKELKYQTTIGTRMIIDEAHYLFDGGIYPKEYDKYKNNKFQGYLEEDFQSFKEASLIAVSNYNSKSKAGCNNEFGLFVRIKEEQNYLLSLNNMKQYVEVYREDGQLIYDLTKLSDLLMDLEDKIEDIEVYYNKRTMSLKGWNVTSNTKKFDIITRREII